MAHFTVKPSLDPSPKRPGNLNHEKRKMNMQNTQLQIGSLVAWQETHEDESVATIVGIEHILTAQGVLTVYTVLSPGGRCRSCQPTELRALEEVAILKALPPSRVIADSVEAYV
jgi:hypothetical protein